MKNVFKSNFKTLSVGFRFVLLFLTFFMFYNARILSSISPCFYGFFVALIFLETKCFDVILSYFLTVCLSNVTVESLIVSSSICVFSLLTSLYFKKKKKPVSLPAFFAFCVLFGLPYIYLKFFSISSLYTSVLDVLFNSVFAISSLYILRTLRKRNYNFNLNVDEALCLCLMVCFLFCGAMSVNFLAFDFVKFFGLTSVMLLSSVVPNLGSVILGLSAGFGASLVSANYEYIVLFSLTSVLCNVFKSNSKFLSASLVVCFDIILNSFFHLFGKFTYIGFASTLASCIVFLSVPKSVLKKLKDRFFFEENGSALKNILNQNKLQVSKRLLYTAEVFYEMDKNFRRLVKGNLDSKSAKNMLCSEVIRQNCENCPQKSKCLKGFNSELKKIFDTLINVGFEKGRITLVDLPSYLTNRCTKTSQIVNNFNSLLSEYKKYLNLVGNIDQSKLLIAEQLKGISNILCDLSKETKQVVQMDPKIEKLIKEHLLYNDILPNEVVCFEKDEYTEVVSLVLKKQDFDKDKILKVLGETLKRKMELDEVVKNDETNLVFCSFKSAPTYDIAVGVAQASKGGEDVCGDTHSLSRLANQKYLLALCDGMGHGGKANKASELSISLIENFYKAGFDNETILSSVNKLLNLNAEEVFSALDVSVIDLKNGEIDFIKQGATIGYVKRKGEINKIESNSLPLGILEEAKPKVTKTVLSPEDTVIMMSDGVVDAFGEEEELKNYLLSLPFRSPQDLADIILKKAKQNNKNYPNDDMTVLVGKIFFNFA